MADSESPISLFDSSALQSTTIMRMRIRSVLAVLASVAIGSSVSAQDRVEISFPVVETRGAETSELQRRRRRTGHYWCDPVSFDISAVLELTERVQSGEVDIESSTLVVGIRDKEQLTYRGEYSSVEEGAKTATWVGRLEGAEDFVASLILQPAAGRATALFDSEQGTYRLFASQRSRIFFLCELDPNQLPRRID